MPELTPRDRNNARKRGKNTEYQCARDMGGEVVGRSKAVKVGKQWVQVNCQQPPDVLAPGGFCFECKNTPMPKKLIKAMNQCLTNAPRGFDNCWVCWHDPKTDMTLYFTIRPIFLGEHGKG